jgi:long-subunit fatty acid transport protein
LYEQNDSPATVKVSSIQFDNELHTFGSGISFNLGAIVKPIPEIRLGVAFESPTWYRLTDELTQRVIGNSVDATGNFTDFVDPQVTNVYDAYKIQTPSKWTGSFAYVYGKKGLLSVDISTKDYSATRFKPKNLYYDLNTAMNSNLTSAMEIRVGGEYRIKQVSLRAGYHLDQSPYRVDQAFGDLTGYSGGIGYNFGESKLDIAYSYEHRNLNQYLISSGMSDSARVSRYNNNIVISYSVNF